MISAVVLTKNEEENIKECLAGLKFCEEIIVIDDNSTDKTKEIAKKEGARVYVRSLDNNFAGQRNYALGLTKEEWMFFIDADERVTPALRQEITNNKLQITKINGFWFKRNDFFMEKLLKHGEAKSVKLLRLARKGSGEWARKVDEKWEIKGQTQLLKNPLLHYSHNNLKEFLESINSRSSLNASQFFSENKKVSFLDWFKPLAKFLQNYFLRFGFLDSTAGFVFAVMMSLHSFLVRGKLYLLWKKSD